MATATYEKHPQQRPGRFGRAKRTREERAFSGYEVDPQAVAEAIVARLRAGGTWR